MKSYDPEIERDLLLGEIIRKIIQMQSDYPKLCFAGTTDPQTFYTFMFWLVRLKVVAKQEIMAHRTAIFPLDFAMINLLGGRPCMCAVCKPMFEKAIREAQ